MARKPKAPKQVETLTHDEASRKNIPTAELQSAAQLAEEVNPFEPVTYVRETPWLCENSLGNASISVDLI